jgi:hypothetical protein
VFPHLAARSPLRILPYPTAPKTLTISKTSTELTLELSQEHHNIDVVR